MSRDIVYYTKPDSENEELRYSLRSIDKNLHRDVTIWVVGHSPSWLTGVRYVQTAQKPGEKHRNAVMNIRTALDTQEVSKTFWMLNDDMYLMKPHDELPLYDWGLVKDVLAHPGADIGQLYHASMAATYDCLLRMGRPDALSYAAHVPDLISKGWMRWTMDNCTRSTLNIQHATIQGNLAGLKSTSLPHDVKIYHNRAIPEWAYDSDYLSTSDHSFNYGHAGMHLRRTFNQPSRYERK